MSTTVDLYVDFVCPFCFLIEPAIEELQRERDVSIRLRAFELRPHPVPTLRPEDPYLPTIWRESVYPMAARLGLSIQLPSISPQPRTTKAFLLLQLAQETGVAAKYARDVFTAFFQDDRDIGDEDVLVDIAGRSGISEEECRQAMGDPVRLEHHSKDLAYASQTVGVSAVPGVVVNGVLLQGVPSAERLKRTVDIMVKREEFLS